jgi:hypothetical protein
MLGATWDVVLELAPWLLLGAVIAGVLHVALPDDFVRRHLRGRGAVLKAVLLGVPLPLCSCGVIPAGLGLKKDGASNGAVVGFLISTPQTGVDSILVSAAFLGWPFAIFKVAAAAVTGWVGGALTDVVDGATLEPPPAQHHCCSKPRPGLKPETRDRSARAAVLHAVDLLRSIWGWLIVGVLASAVISTFVPPAVIGSAAQYGLAATLGLALAIALPIYVCATASVPIAAALVAGGLPAGAALVFLMAGPATNVATVGAVGRTLGRRTLAVYLGTIIVGSVGLAYAFDSILPTSSQVEHQHGGPSWVAIASAVVLLALFAKFAIEKLRAR